MCQYIKHRNYNLMVCGIRGGDVPASLGQQLYSAATCRTTFSLPRSCFSLSAFCHFIIFSLLPTLCLSLSPLFSACLSLCLSYSRSLSLLLPSYLIRFAFKKPIQVLKFAFGFLMNTSLGWAIIDFSTWPWLHVVRNNLLVNHVTLSISDSL